MSDYLKVVYNEKTHPYNEYPEKLCYYLFNTFEMFQNMKFLEAGCGRGDFLKQFKKLKLDVYGLDLSSESPSYSPELKIDICDVEKESLPYPDNYFDIVYSKSFLEHLYYPEIFAKETFRILKPGGLFLSLVPDWETEYKIFFDDYTHRTPFTKVSLCDFYQIYGFDKTKVFKFRQLPLVWKYPKLNYICDIISPFIPIRTEIKFLKWSKLKMLIASGRKPNN